MTEKQYSKEAMKIAREAIAKAEETESGEE